MPLAKPPCWYLIPGLGADERVFQFLRLHGEVRVLSWLPLLSPTETLPHYAERLAAAVPVQEACWVVGVSFGGILAQEVGRLRPLANIVLISSITNAKQLPWALRAARATGVYRLVPPQLLQLAPRVAQWFFGARNGKEYRLLCQILADTDPAFARWAIAHLLHWNSASTRPAIRLHGTHDRLLPLGPALVKYPIDHAGHFMIVSHAAKVSEILNHLAADSSTPF